MQQYLEKIKLNLKRKEVILLIILTLIGIFLRCYHHQDWLHFQLDQSRDAYIINDVIGENGSLENLPLVGPYARGTGLFLGPIFYYFQIVAGFIFGNSPEKLAYPDLLFSILTIPLSYLLFRKYFSTNFSLGLTSITTFSLFLIKYGRFAWNPNSMPFFIVLGILALLYSIDKNKKIKTKWFLLMIACFTIASQLHFVALLSLVLILTTYLIYKRPIFKIKQIIFSLLVITFLYSPIVVYEIKTKGENTKNFIAAISEKKEKDDNKTLLEKTFRNLQETSRTYWVINSSDQHGTLIRTNTKKFPLKLMCNKQCKKERPFLFVEIILFILSFGLLIYLFKKEKNQQKKDFLFLMTTWISASFIILIPLAFQISPRFYLVTAIPAIFLFGLLLKFTIEKIKYGKYFTIAIILLAILINLINTAIYFNKLKNAKTIPTYLDKDLMVQKKEVVTLELIENVSDYMITEKINNGPIEFVCNNRYARALKYTLDKRHNQKSEYFKKTTFIPADNKNFYLITKTISRSQVPKEIINKFQITNVKEIGTFTVYQLKPRLQ